MLCAAEGLFLLRGGDEPDIPGSLASLQRLQTMGQRGQRSPVIQRVTRQVILAQLDWRLGE